MKGVECGMKGVWCKVWGESRGGGGAGWKVHSARCGVYGVYKGDVRAEDGNRCRFGVAPSACDESGGSTTQNRGPLFRLNS